MYKLGYVDLMNEASQCVALSTGAKPYDIVLLYGARKGAKALALASMLRGNGMIYLWEVRPPTHPPTTIPHFNRRLLNHPPTHPPLQQPYLRQHYQLREAIKRCQAQDLMEVLPNVNAAMRLKADVVLVDAMCSNTGALAHHPVRPPTHPPILFSSSSIYLPYLPLTHPPTHLPSPPKHSPCAG